MMTKELNVCVLAAPLAAIDRRVLSQAWYSALHCASGTRTQTAPRATKRAATGSHIAVAPTARDPRSSPAASGATAVRAKDGNIRERSGGTDTDRRARRSQLARRIERKFLDPRQRAGRATFVAGGKRVHVLVQSSAGRVGLVAVCAPALRETVARALAQARFALASRGVRCS